MSRHRVLAVIALVAAGSLGLVMVVVGVAQNVAYTAPATVTSSTPHLPMSTTVNTPTTASATDLPVPSSTTEPRATPPPPPPAEPSYANCDAVRAAGAAPIYPGDPGFEPKFDRDHDGIGCE